MSGLKIKLHRNFENILSVQRKRQQHYINFRLIGVSGVVRDTSRVCFRRVNRNWPKRFRLCYLTVINI